MYPTVHQRRRQNDQLLYRDLVGTAVNHVFFGMGNVLGVALGGFLMAAAFEAHTGLSGIGLSTDHPVGFVAALNTTFLAAVGLTLLGLVTSLARGNKAS